MNTLKPLLIGVIVGVAVTMVTGMMFLPEPIISAHGQQTAMPEKQPLYWVAPMDANYRRDKPGLSPMGMDLIPVYEEEKTDTGPGTIKISSQVVNNLGVRVAIVSRQALQTEIKTVGYVRYDEDQLVHIHPRVEGWIEKLYVKTAGDPVQKGQPLYEIYSPALVNAQEELVIALDRKNKRLIQASKDRLKALKLPDSVIKQLIKDRKVQQSILFLAPQTGVVDNLNIREGFFVKPGTLLMSVGSLDQVWVEAQVFERQAFMVNKDQSVTMSLDFLPGKQWQGKVDYVYPTLDPKKRTVKVRLRFDNENEALKPNMFAQVVIHSNSDDEALLVPKEAVIRSGNADRVVLAFGEGRFKSVEVKLGRFDEQFIEVLSGLVEGESIVTSAQFLLDSESSKTSDFKRIDNQADEPDNQATVNGVINSIMLGHRMLNISRGPIEKWQRPAAIMDFIVDESVDLSKLTEGMNIRFTFAISEDEFVITDIEQSTESQP